MNILNDIYKNVEEYDSNKILKILIVFNDMIAEMLGNEKSSPVLNELFIGGTKLNISVIFITQFYSAVLKKNRLNSI